MNKEQLVLFINAIDELTIFYNGNANKVADWMTTENRNLGGSKPINFFAADKGRRVVNYIKQVTEENNINVSSDETEKLEDMEKLFIEEGYLKAVDQLRRSYDPKLETALGAPSALAWASYLESMKDEVLK